jgi:hypothetical protein
VEGGTEDKITRSVERVLEVAKQQKRLIWLFLTQLLLTIPMIFNVPVSGDSAVWVLPSLILVIISAYFIYMIGRALEMSTLWLVITILLLFAPYIGLFPLLYVNSMATKFLRTAGVKVGLMGAKRRSLDEIRELE